MTVTEGVPSPNPTAVPHKTWCITQADVFRNGNYVTVARSPDGADGECNSPPPYHGHPYSITLGAEVEPTEVPNDATWCVTVADVDWNGIPVPVDANPAGSDGKCFSASTYRGYPAVTLPSSVSPRPSAGPLPHPSSPVPRGSSSALPTPVPTGTSAGPPPPPPASVSPPPPPPSPPPDKHHSQYVR